jgi:hypothetical protein
MRLETWVIGILLVTLTLTAFIGFYMEQSDSQHYNTVGSIPSNFSAVYDKYTIDKSAETEQNMTNLIIDMTENAQNAKTVDTGSGVDMLKSQTNILKQAWDFFSSIGNAFDGLKRMILSAANLLNIPPVLTYTVFGIIAALLLFAFINAIFGRNI